MRTLMSETPVRKQASIRPRTWGVLTLIFASLLVLYSVYELTATKREQLHIMNEHAAALITSMQKSGSNALNSFDIIEDLLAEKLLTLARMLVRLDAQNSLTQADIEQIASKNRIFRINIFDKAGNRQFSNMTPGNNDGPGPGPGRGRNRPESPRLFQLFNDTDANELIMGFKQSRFGAGDRFAVAVKRPRGGAIVLNIDAQEMLNFRRQIGLGKLIRDVAASQGIEYITLQDSSGILLASAGVDSLSGLDSDAFLSGALTSATPVTRFTTFHAQKIYEVVGSFSTTENQVMRIGLSIQHLQEAEANTRIRLFIASLLFLGVGVLTTIRVIDNQNYSLLQRAYTQIESYTGSILTHMEEAVVAVDASNKITLVNRAMAFLTGQPAKHLMGQACAMVIPAMSDYFAEVINTRQDVHHNALHIQFNANAYIVDLSIHVVPAQQQKDDVIFAVIRDVTRQKQLEANLARREQISAMGHLASGVAHEIRNPLNAISMIAQRLKAEFTPQSDETEYQQLSATMIDETRRINDIIQQFLQFARPPELHKTRFAVGPLFSELHMLTREEANSKGIDLQINVTGDPELFADRDQLKQVLLNLVNNALQACSKDNVISLTAHHQDGNVELIIADTGPGIAPENLNKIFNMYFTTRKEGTGLGLSMVQQIVSRHDGAITVNSTPDEGTQFIIQLPEGE